MARFDVYRNISTTSDDVPYLLDVQSDVLNSLDSRVVVPLRRLDRFPAVKLPTNLSPIVVIDGLECVLETPKLASVPARILKSPVISLEAQRFEIGAALDFLFQGF